MTDDYDYQLKAEGVPGSDWVSVTKEEWIKAERAAGFRPPLWSGHPDYATTCATGGFSNSQGISGRMVRAASAPVDHVAAPPGYALVPITPSKSMIDAGHRTYSQESLATEWIARAVWTAMVSTVKLEDQP